MPQNNTNLRRANATKNDEFYTQFKDIEKEMYYYKNFFNGKVVYCNCDDPIESNFTKYFILKFRELGLKELICTFFDEEMRLCGWRNSKTGEEILSREASSYQELAFSGIHVVRRELIDLIPSAEKQSITPIYVELSKTQLLKGFLHNEGHWKDMGKIEDFNS